MSAKNDTLDEGANGMSDAETKVRAYCRLMGWEVSNPGQGWEYSIYLCYQLFYLFGFDTWDQALAFIREPDKLQQSWWKRWVTKPP